MASSAGRTSEAEHASDASEDAALFFVSGGPGCAEGRVCDVWLGVSVFNNSFLVPSLTGPYLFGEKGLGREQGAQGILLGR